MNRLAKQIFRFMLVGGLSTAIDFIVLYVLHHQFQMNYLLATGVAFAVATVFNYWASMTFIFESKFTQEQKKQEFSLFLILSLCGLGLTELLMFISVDLFASPVMLGKLFVTAIVMVFNFVTRKRFIEGKTS
ncbi:GtrA family protein [Fundicoccus sp. Sow4_D5]|uniref:GtrA family protein n=1 Tax=unclassified Fundicoccus TaxID=2761543 RepID=UPI003F91FE60